MKLNKPFANLMILTGLLVSNSGLIWAQDPQVKASSASLRIVSEAKDTGVDKKALSRIDERMQKFVDDKQVAGVVTLVAKNGTIVHLSAVGQSDRSANKSMETNSVFAIASMTKPITAAAVMILQDEGKLDLDDPVSKYIPSFKTTTLVGGKSPTREVTIRDCLRHTNGLVSDQQNVGSLENTAEVLAKSELVFEPGSKWQYGPGLSVAGRVVEVASGKPFDQFLKEKIFQPLEMAETSFHPSEEQLSRLAKLYQPSQDKLDLVPGSHWLLEVSPDKSPNPSGGLYSTASDLVRFYQMVLNGGVLGDKRVLSESAVKEMTSIQTDELKTGFTDGNGWGLGFCVVREPQGPTALLSPGSFGHGGAFGTQGWIDPKEKAIYVLLIARQNFGNGDASDLRVELQKLARESFR